MSYDLTERLYSFSLWCDDVADASMALEAKNEIERLRAELALAYGLNGDDDDDA